MEDQIPLPVFSIGIESLADSACSQLHYRCKWVHPNPYYVFAGGSTPSSPTNTASAQSTPNTPGILLGGKSSSFVSSFKEGYQVYECICLWTFQLVMPQQAYEPELAINIKGQKESSSPQISVLWFFQ